MFIWLFSGIRFVILFVILLGLSLNWVFALFVVFRKQPPSAKKELVIRVVVWVIFLLFLVATSALHIYISLQHVISSFEYSSFEIIVAWSKWLTFALRLGLLIMAAFLVFCAVCSLVVLKRDSKGESKSTTQGCFNVI